MNLAKAMFGATFFSPNNPREVFHPIITTDGENPYSNESFLLSQTVFSPDVRALEAKYMGLNTTRLFCSKAAPIPQALAGRVMYDRLGAYWVNKVLVHKAKIYGST